jgi:Enoyl-CoA hydratase/isomerase
VYCETSGLHGRADRHRGHGRRHRHADPESSRAPQRAVDPEPLQWIVGHGLARDLLLTGRRLDAEEAHRIGLVSRVVDDDALLEQALATARTIAEAPQPTLEATKRYLVGSAGATFEQAFAVEHDGVFETFLTGAVGPRQDA